EPRRRRRDRARIETAAGRNGDMPGVPARRRDRPVEQLACPFDIVLIVSKGRRRVEIGSPIVAMTDARGVDGDERAAGNALDAPVEGAPALAKIGDHEIRERELVDFTRHARQRKQGSERGGEGYGAASAIGEKRSVSQAVAPEHQPAGVRVPQHESEGAKTPGNAGTAPALDHAQDESGIRYAVELRAREPQGGA